MSTLLIIGVGLMSLPASAWNATGHREVVAVAWSMSSPQTQQAISRLLSQQTVINTTRGLDGVSAWMAAALWPDELRDLSDSAHEMPPPVNTQEWLTRARTGTATRRWHFADRDIARPFYQQRAHGLLETALSAQVSILSDAKAPKEDRAIALAWVSHLLADAHQPLHTASRADPQRPGQLDAGGNTVMVFDAGRRPPEPLSLHRWWDELPGHARPDSVRFDNDVLRLVRQSQQTGETGQNLSTGAWIEESFIIARDRVYPGLSPDPDNPSSFLIRQDYWLEGRDITRQQLATAARRLADLIARALQDIR